VTTVKALLAATTEDRKKRGKYLKYDQELREVRKYNLVLTEEEFWAIKFMIELL
jgi:hypothetical protein